jgi:hypothetical protein
MGQLNGMDWVISRMAVMACGMHAAGKIAGMVMMLSMRQADFVQSWRDM